MGMSSLTSNTRVFGIRAHSSKAKNEWKSIFYKAIFLENNLLESKKGRGFHHAPFRINLS